jgi:hypothetical protein
LQFTAFCIYRQSSEVTGTHQDDSKNFAWSKRSSLACTVAWCSCNCSLVDHNSPSSSVKGGAAAFQSKANKKQQLVCWYLTLAAVKAVAAAADAPIYLHFTAPNSLVSIDSM